MLVKEILSALIMIFILIIPGFFFGKKRIIDEHQSQGISALAVNLTWPCLVIDAMQLKFSMQTLRDSAYMMGIALLVFGAILVISFPLAKLLRLPKTKQYVMLFMLLFGNTGFIGIPVIKALYGSEAVFYAAILEMINDLLMFTIGILLMQMSAGSKLKIRAKDFLSPGLIGVLIGLAPVQPELLLLLIILYLAGSALLIRPQTKRTRITYIFFAAGAAVLMMIQRIPRQVFWGALLISAIVIHKNSIRQEFLEETTESLESL